MNEATGQAVFFALLRSGLWERPLTDNEREAVAALGTDDWAELVSLARRQTVPGLFYRALAQLPADFPVPGDIVLELMSLAGGIERENRLHDTVTEQLFAESAGAGLHPVVMKGSAIAVYYAHPELRSSGDIDLYFPPDEFTRALAVFGGERASDGTVHLQRDGVDIDLHDRYFDLHCAADRLPEVGTPEATILMLSAHILKHAVGAGIGIRQCCDLSAACHALADALDPAALRDLFRRTGTFRWNRLLFSFLADVLDLPETVFAGERVSSQPLLRIIQEGGNFGHHAAARTKALQAGERRRKWNTFGRFLHRLPFSLRYAPRETVATIANLVRGNLRLRRR